MNPTMGLMLSRSVEEDRRRTIAHRPSRPNLAPASHSRENLSLTDIYRIPRLGFEPSKS